MVPRTYHADSMMLFCDPADQPVQAAVLEVQRSRDKTKLHTWKLYVAQLESELNVSTTLVIFCPKPAVARWYRGHLLAGPGLSSLALQPLIFTKEDVPLVVDRISAEADPALVVFSALCHGEHAGLDEMFPALAAALRSVGVDRARMYYDVVLAGLPVAARERLEAYMTVAIEKYRSELFRTLAAEAEERGEARGEGRAVLTVLESRSVPVPEAVREQILACTDLTQLETWLRRAVTATTTADVLRD